MPPLPQDSNQALRYTASGPLSSLQEKGEGKQNVQNSTLAGRSKEWNTCFGGIVPSLSRFLKNLLIFSAHVHSSFSVLEQLFVGTAVCGQQAPFIWEYVSTQEGPTWCQYIVIFIFTYICIQHIYSYISLQFHAVYIYKVIECHFVMFFFPEEKLIYCSVYSKSYTRSRFFSILAPNKYLRIY